MCRRDVLTSLVHDDLPRNDTPFWRTGRLQQYRRRCYIRWKTADTVIATELWLIDIYSVYNHDLNPITALPQRAYWYIEGLGSVYTSVLSY